MTKNQIVRLSNQAMEEVLDGEEEEKEWIGVKGVPRGEREWLEIIDRGNSEGGPLGRTSLFP